VDETGVPEENHRPAASHCQFYHIMLCYIYIDIYNKHDIYYFVHENIFVVDDIASSAQIDYQKYVLDISAYCLCKHVSISKQGRHMMENSLEFDKKYYLRGSKCRSEQPV
jgi:hypothetical protein